MNQEKIGKFIAKKRKEKNLTQQELANKIGVTYQAISKWENGRGMPDYTYFEPLCRELDITTSELLSGGEKEDKTLDYIKYKNKEGKRYILYITITLLTIFILSLICIFVKYKNFYKTNYKQNQIYKLQGEGDNFSIYNTLVITSPYKTILVTPKIMPKTNEIPENNIVGFSIDYEDNLIISQGGPYTSLMPTIIEELNGYDEIFNKEKLDNLDKWTVTVFYIKDDERVSETIKLNKEEIFNTDKYEKEEIEPIARPEDQPEKKDYTELKENLMNNGFRKVTENMYELETNKYDLLYMLDVDAIYYSYEPDVYKKIIFNYLLNLNGNAFVTFRDPSDMGMDPSKNQYEIKNNKVQCYQENKCNKENIKEIEKAYNIIKEYLV